MRARRLGDEIHDLGLGVGDLPAGQDANAAIDIAPGWDAGGPVTALDDSRVEIERMIDRLERGMRLGAPVPLGFETFELLDQMNGGLDRIRASPGARDMDGYPAHF